MGEFICRIYQWSRYVGRVNPGGYLPSERRPPGLWGWRISPATAWELAGLICRDRIDGVEEVTLGH